jgi:hypothetical protein
VIVQLGLAWLCKTPGISRTARGDRFGAKIIHILAARATESVQHLDGFAAIADGVGDEFSKLGACQQHHENGVADDDARGGVVGELGIVRKAEGLETRDRLARSETGRLMKT